MSQLLVPRASLGGSGPAVPMAGGRRLRYVSRPDVGFLHREIVHDRCYLKHGVVLSPGDVVLDVGANIGMVGLIFPNYLHPLPDRDAHSQPANRHPPPPPRHPLPPSPNPQPPSPTPLPVVRRFRS